MPEITFFEPARLGPYDEWDAHPSQSLQLGDWHFTLTCTKAINGPLTPGGRWDFIGYEVVYHNNEISQEETDALMQRYRQTRQG